MHLPIRARFLATLSITLLLFLFAGCSSVTPQSSIIPTPTGQQTIPVSPTHTATQPTATTTPPTLPAAEPTESAPLPIRDSIFGASVVPLDERGGLREAVAANLAWTRVDLPWDQIENVQGQLNWGKINKLEERFIAAAQSKMKVILIIGGTPKWAVKPGFACGVVRDDALEALASFARASVERYSAQPYNIRYWEIYNEPDVQGFLGCWGDTADGQFFGGEAYGRMLQKVYPAMKSADPTAQVLVGGLLLDCDPVNPPDLPDQPGVKKNCIPARFLEGALKAGAAGSFDGVAFHSYDYYAAYAEYDNTNWHSSRQTSRSSAASKAAYLRAVLKQYGVEAKLYNTEFALFCGRPGDHSCDPFIDEVEATKAYYAVQFMADAMAEGYETAIWYAFFYDRNNSLLNKDFSPKPVYHAMEFTNRILSKTRFVQTVKDTNFIIQEFRSQNQTVWVAWTIDNQSHTLKLPEAASEIYIIGKDGQAQPQKAATEVQLDVAPAVILFNRPSK